MPRMTDKKRKEHRQVQGTEVESDPDTSSNMFMSPTDIAVPYLAKKLGTVSNPFLRRGA